MTLRTDVCRSTPAVVFLSCLSGSVPAAPLISRLSLMPLLPWYSVSCKLVEYSLRRGLLRKFFHENNDGSLSLSGFAARAARNGRRYLMVSRYVMTRIAKMDTTMMDIYTCVSEPIASGQRSLQRKYDGFRMEWTYYDKGPVILVHSLLQRAFPCVSGR